MTKQQKLASLVTAHERMLETNRAIRAGAGLRDLVAMDYTPVAAYMLHAHGGYPARMVHSVNSKIKNINKRGSHNV